MILQNYIRSIPDYPRPGIVFRDITTLLEQPDVLREAADRLVDLCTGHNVDKVAVIESRGFILGGILAYKLGVGLVIIRKKGKLPYATHSIDYALEYGTDTLEVHMDSIRHGERVLLHDDLLATGGTMAAAASLVRTSGGSVVCATFLVELGFLPGRERLAAAGVDRVSSLVIYNNK